MLAGQRTVGILPSKYEQYGFLSWRFGYVFERIRTRLGMYSDSNTIQPTMPTQHVFHDVRVGKEEYQ